MKDEGGRKIKKTNQGFHAISHRPIASHFMLHPSSLILAPHPKLTPRSFPIRNVSSPAPPPIVSIRSPPRSACRPVNSDSAAPTANSDTAVSPTDTARLAAPELHRKGSNGNRAPAANEKKENPAAPQGEPSSSGLRPSSSRASVSSALSGSTRITSAIRLASSSGMPRAT